MRLLNLVIIFLIIAIPFAQAQEFENPQHEITKVVHIYRGKGSTVLNISNPQDLEKYAPTKRFWNENLTGPGKILDGVLPPDIWYLNSSSLSLSWNFSISSDIIADGASHFILRLPVSFDASSPDISLQLSTANSVVCHYSTAENVEKTELGIYDMKIDYVNRTLHLWYLNLSGFIFPGQNYQLELTISDISHPAILIYSYDYLNDNITQFYLNGKNYTGNLAVGFEFKQLSSNSISSIYVHRSCLYTVNLNKSYSGNYYVSFAWEVYTSQQQNLTVSISGMTTNSTIIKLTEGLNTIRGDLLISISGKIINVNFTGEHPFYIVIEGISSDIIHLPFLKVYTKPYGDLVVNEEEYYLPGVIVLPGSWMQSMALALKYAPPALLPVILEEAVYHTTIYAFLKVYAEISYLIYKGVDFLGGLIEDLLGYIVKGLYALFNWTFTTVVHWVMSNVGWWLWAVLKGVWFLLQVGIYVLAVWFTDSFLRGIVALPDRGVKGMLQEWSGTTTFIENLASKIKGWLP